MAVEATQQVKPQTAPAPSPAPAPEAKKIEKSKPAEVVGTVAATDPKAAPAPKAPVEATVASATKAPTQGQKLDVKA